MPYCDGCGKERRDVVSCGRDSDGLPDAPDLCFICRKENERGRCYSEKHGRYVPYGLLEAEAIDAEYQRSREIE